MDVKLTKDADKLICLPYSEYLNALEAGIPKENARYFGSSDDIYKRLL